MISILLRWAGYVLFAGAAVFVGFSVWSAFRGDMFGVASSFVTALGPLVGGLVVVGLAKIIDDVAAPRREAERRAN